MKYRDFVGVILNKGYARYQNEVGLIKWKKPNALTWFYADSKGLGVVDSKDKDVVARHPWSCITLDEDALVINDKGYDYSILVE